mmetsp:Transcript_6200/g.18336  ORF Transcript_6200/g.18336 Transcript_6200/m.18336 type:complete len:98 (-) Transcript_6200:179-472(-)
MKDETIRASQFGRGLGDARFHSFLPWERQTDNRHEVVPFVGRASSEYRQQTHSFLVLVLANFRGHDRNDGCNDCAVTVTDGGNHTANLPFIEHSSTF